MQMVRIILPHFQRSLTRKKMHIEKTNEKIKILFLDIDGVCNSRYWYYTRNRVKSESMEHYHAQEFDPECVRMVKHIVKATGCKIVLSSVWRLGEDTRIAVKAEGLDFIDITPTLHRPINTGEEYRERGREVAMWLSQHPEVENYAILDDEGDFFDWQFLFQTDNLIGITEDIAIRVINHFGAKLSTYRNLRRIQK